MRAIAILKLGGAAVQLKNDTVTLTHTGSATAQINLNNAGNVVSVNGLNYNWLLRGSASNYEVFATFVSGNSITGTFGSWLNLGTLRTWSITSNISGVEKTGNMTLQIRQVGGSNILATASITLDASVP